MENLYETRTVTTKEARQLATIPGAIIHWTPSGEIGDPITGEGSFATYSNSRLG